MNKFMAIGRLVKDPVKRVSADGKTTIGAFDIAIDRKYKRQDDPDADFFSCTCFGKLAEFVDKHLSKGSKIAIVGEVQNNNYTNKNGEKVYGTKIVVNEIEFAESKKAEKPADDQGFFTPEEMDNLPFK